MSRRHGATKSWAVRCFLHVGVYVVCALLVHAGIRRARRARSSHAHQAKGACSPLPVIVPDLAEYMNKAYADNVTCLGPGIDHHELLAPEYRALNAAGHIALCFDFAELQEHGAVESWFWPLYETVFTQPPFFVHAVAVRHRHSGAVTLRLRRGGAHFNPSDFDLMRHCNVLVQVGTPPLRHWGRHRVFPRILVVPHLSSSPQSGPQYDAVMTVAPSPTAGRARGHVIGTRSRIPPAIAGCVLEPTKPRTHLQREWGIAKDKKVLLFGSFHPKGKSDCNATCFTTILRHLDDSWVGVIVDPAAACSASPRLRCATGYRHPGDVLLLADVVLLAGTAYVLPKGRVSAPPSRQ